MAYRVVVKPRAESDLEDLERAVREKAVERIDDLRSDARPHDAKKLRGSDLYSIRVGRDYRMTYAIDDREKTVEIARILHRRDIYRWM